LSILSAGALADAMPLYLGLPGSDTAELANQLERIAGWSIDGYLVTCPITPNHPRTAFSSIS